MHAHQDRTLGNPNLTPQAVANYNEQWAMEPAQRPEQIVPMAPPLTTVATASPAHAGAHPTVNVNVNTPMVPMIVTAPAGPAMIVRILWYVFIGWWLSALV